MAEPMETISEALLARARGLSSATLHEAARRRGALPHWLRPISPTMQMAGRALPVRCPAGDNLQIHHALAAAAADDVLVVDTGPEGVGFGYWGEIMATAALVAKIAGLVITGGVRDTQRLIALGLPTFSAAVAIRGTSKERDADGAVGEPVRIGEIVVRKGDLVVGDADGLVVLAPELAAATIPLAEERDRKEAAILERIRGGARTLDIYNF